MSTDRTVAVGDYGYSKIRCDGYNDTGRRCNATVTGAFRRGIVSARAIAKDMWWSVGLQVGSGKIRDYCPKHAVQGTAR